jgi:hypothetical protein
VWPFWIVLGVCVVLVTVARVVLLWLGRLARRGTSGTECVAIAFVPLFLLSWLALPAGAVAAFALAAAARTPAVLGLLYAVGAALSALGLLDAIGLFRGLARQRAECREIRRVMSQGEFIALLRSGAIKSFHRDARGAVTMTYADNCRNADGHYEYRSDHADPAGFPHYVATAKALHPDPAIRYADLSGSE